MAKSTQLNVFDITVEISVIMVVALQQNYGKDTKPAASEMLRQAFTFNLRLI